MMILKIKNMNQKQLNEVVAAQAEIYKPSIQKMMAEAEDHDCGRMIDDSCRICDRDE